jgi:thioesterase domain-containing protein/acyl carrier protein
VLRACDGTLTPQGGTGMLWIGGPAVAGGYLGDDALSAEAFQPDPFTPGGRLYRTGDQARWRADGQLEFLGRRDRQIKLRGQRIDLHQVERLLAGLNGVQQVHVALLGDLPQAARLVAWVVTQPGVTVAEVAKRASRSLPAAMVPQLVGMTSLPIGANGKVDARALPVPQPAPAAPAEDLPKDPLTRSIAACMAEVLDRSHVPADASFSDQGGDSLLALRLISLIEKRTGHVLQTANLHHHGTAAALARLLQSGTTAPRYTIPIQPKGARPPFFAIHVLGRNEDLFRPLAAALGPDQPLFGLSVGIPRNLDDINVERTARIYFDEIQAYHPTGPVGLGAVSMAAYFAYELAQLLHSAGREVRVLAVLDAMGPDGRPALTGAAKARAHLQQVRQHGLWHFARVVKNRLDRYRERREALRSAPDQVNAHNLIAANVCAVEFYRPKPYDGPLTVFRADHSFWDSPEALATGLGWASVARGGLKMHDLPGTHLSILHPGCRWR